MIIVDLSHVFYSSLYTGEADKLDENFLRHLVWNIIRANRMKFHNEYGEVVIACDGPNYWRKQYFPYYKAGRKKSRDDSAFDFEEVFRIFNVLKSELTEFSPYCTIQIDGAEADDIIATLVSEKLEADIETDGVASLLGEEPVHKTLILSGDKDFLQLHRFPGVAQYNPVLKKFLTTEDPTNYLFEHIVRAGDDGIPNIFSDDDTFVNDGKRQTPVRAKKLQELKDTPFDEWPTALQRNWARNEVLIDLKNVPEGIRDQVVEQYKSHQPTRKHLMNFFVEKKMKLMLESLGDF